jgi:hypothetical protein
MLFASSRRAFSSTSAVTCFPFSARLRDEIDYRSKRFEGVMQQDIVIRNLGKQIVVIP